MKKSLLPELEKLSNKQRSVELCDEFTNLGGEMSGTPIGLVFIEKSFCRDPPLVNSA
jgi:hypothetical protein